MRAGASASPSGLARPLLLAISVLRAIRPLLGDHCCNLGGAEPRMSHQAIFARFPRSLRDISLLPGLPRDVSNQAQSNQQRRRHLACPLEEFELIICEWSAVRYCGAGGDAAGCSELDCLHRGGDQVVELERAAVISGP